MKIKKFLASSLKAGIEKMKEEIGPDAVILSTRTTTVNDVELIEIVAGIEEPIFSDEQQPTIGDLVRKSFERERQEQEESEKKGIASSQTQVTNHIETSLTHQMEQSKVIDDLAVLKKQLASIEQSIKYRHAASFSPRSAAIYMKLMSQGIGENESLRIAGILSSMKSSSSMESLLQLARKELLSSITFSKPLEKKGHNVITFVGPTGSGKTTTIAKLAVVCKIVFQANILVVSADTIKVGGAEQLQTFTSIAGIPFQSVYSIQDLRFLLKQEQYRDIILIDTVGRSHKNKEHLEELSNVHDATNPNSSLLVLPANYSAATIDSIITNFQPLGIDGVILSKIDEVDQLGIVIEALKKHSLPLAYFTTGQKVPGDLEPATAELLSQLILPDTITIDY
jgi:flagellar biosynthesis protein FlhF